VARGRRPHGHRRAGFLKSAALHRRGGSAEHSRTRNVGGWLTVGPSGMLAPSLRTGRTMQKQARDIAEQLREIGDPRERSARLAALCKGDAALCAAVEALLASSIQTLDETPNTIDGDAGKQTRETGGQESAGAQIDRYRLLQLLGEGGFGTVWLAEQREPVRRRVALKIIKLGMDTRQVIARFEAERQALAMMDHPSIARVLDAGATESGRPYFVMELVRGVPVTTYCDQEKLGTAERLALFREICHAIQHAHQKGIIHRDIKPNNVLVALHDGRPVPKVIDFGIAKATTGELTQRTLLTEFRQVIGTPAYMSPEQADQSGLGIDTRSDIYSLGVLLYELLIGTTPFDSAALVERGYAEMMRIIRDEEPPRPSTRLQALGDTAARIASERRTDLTHLRTQLRGDLDWIVMRCLEKDRARRYETANALAADIGRHLRHEPVAAGPPWVGYRLRKFVRRNRAAVLAAGAVSAALIIGIVGTSLGLLWALEERDRAQAATASAEREVARTSALARVLTDDLIKAVDPWRGGAGMPLGEAIMAAASSMRSRLADEPDLRADVELALSDSLHALGEFDESLRLAESAYDYRRAALGEDAEETIAALQRIGRSRVAGGDASGATEIYRALFAGLSQRSEVPVSEEIEIVSGLSRSLLDFGNVREAIELLETHLAAMRERKLDAEDIRHMERQLAQRYAQAGQMREAVDVLSRRFDLDSAPMTMTPADAEALVMYASALSHIRDRRALQVAEESVRVQERLFGSDHPNTITSKRVKSEILLFLKRFDEANALAEHVYRTMGDRLGPDHPVVFSAAMHYGNTLLRVGEIDGAVRLHRETLERRRHVLGRLHPDVGLSLEALALAVFERGHLDESIELLEEALEVAVAVFPPASAIELNIMANLSYMLRRAGQLERTRDLLIRLIEMEEEVMGEAAQLTLDDVQTLVQVLRDLGELDEALARAERLRALRPRSEDFVADRVADARAYADVLRDLNRLDDAAQVLEEALDLVASGDQAMRLTLLATLIEVREQQGDPAAAAHLKVQRAALQDTALETEETHASP